MRRTTARHLLAAAVLVSTAAVSAAAQRLFADVTGKWTMTIAAPDGAQESSIVFKQEAEALSGTIENQVVGSAKLAGTVKGDTIKFAFTLNFQNMPYEIRVGGVIKDKDNITGQLEAPNGMGTFPFTAKRIP